MSARVVKVAHSAKLTADCMGHDEIAEVSRLSGLKRLNSGLKRWHQSTLSFYCHVLKDGIPNIFIARYCKMTLTTNLGYLKGLGYAMNISCISM